MKILLVDDEPVNTKFIQLILTEEGYEVTAVDNSRGAYALLQKQLPDLILLDVNMPQVNGFDFYRRLHEQDYDVPVIFVTGRGVLEDRLQGLRMGADDYIVKPFDPAELLARIQAVLRRYRKAKALAVGQVLRSGAFELNLADLQVSLPDQRCISLTPREMKVLAMLASHADQIVPREELLSAIWGEEDDRDSNIVDVYIRRLRLKIERDPANPHYIQSARGIGYRFVSK